MTALYVDIDEHACVWTENLIKAGVIAPGEVWCRDIKDIRPDELQNFTQCHFFCGVSVWSYALRQAGWEDSRRVWTGSCPCQSFSAAGKRAGFADERHLWPAFHWLIHQCRPETVFGEQVASKDGLAWLDLVCADLEGTGYAGWAGDLCAAGAGAPQIRQRLFFVANAAESRRCGRSRRPAGADWWPAEEPGRLRDAERVAGAEGERLQRREDDGDEGWRQRASGQGCEASELGDADEPRLEGRGLPERGRPDECALGRAGDLVRPGPTNGFWRDADWIGCTDGKWRPVESGHEPLVDGSAFRLGSGGAFENKSRAKMLKGYGNAIVAPLAVEFIKAAMECLP